MKIAISLPEKEFWVLEKLKSKLKKSRSELIQEAIVCWLASHTQKELTDQYDRGYQRKPEKVSHVAVFEKAQYDTLSTENW